MLCGSWAGLGWGSGRPGQAHMRPCNWVGSRAAVTSASVTTLFLNRRSSSSSDEHLGVCQGKL